MTQRTVRTANMWREFQRIVKQDHIATGVVVQNHDDGTSTVLLSGDGGVSIRVRGVTVAPGFYAFIQNGTIIGQAASYPGAPTLIPV
jgi:predicted metal-dependent enzyme (double-stranded beta helix superfamily)